MYDRAICWMLYDMTSTVLTCRTSPELARVKTPVCVGISVAMLPLPSFPS